MELLDTVFDLLSDERRRYALYYLEQENDPVAVDELVEQVGKWETTDARDSIPEEKFERIEVEFYHTDLPKASELEYISYDQTEGMVELAGAPPQVDAIIQVAKVIERPDRNP